MRFLVDPADQADHDRLQQLISERQQAQGGPPDGLMVHLTSPSGTGVAVVQAWRTEACFRDAYEAFIAPALAEVGLQAGEPEIAPA